MIISHKYKFIFIRIPKCASTSIESALKKIDPDCICTSGDNYPYGHETMAQLKNDIIDSEKYKEYFKFGFFRNPYKWFISQMNDMQYRELTEYSRLVLDKNLERKMLPKLMDNVINLNDALNLQCHLANAYLHFASRKGYLCQKSWLEDDVDFVGNIENLENEWDFLMEKLNLSEKKIKLEKLNSAEENVNKIKLCRDSIEFIDLFLKEDFKIFKEKWEIDKNNLIKQVNIVNDL